MARLVDQGALIKVHGTAGILGGFRIVGHHDEGFAELVVYALQNGLVSPL